MSDENGAANVEATPEQQQEGKPVDTRPSFPPGHKLKIHPVCNYMPRPDDATYQGIKASIEKLGYVINPVLVWNGSLMDGLTRKTICDDLNVPCPYTEWPGDEAEAVDYVNGLNIHRRTLTSSQKAMLAVLSDEMSYKYMGKRRPKDESQKDRAGRLAAAFGTNRQYVYYGIYLRDARSPLVAKVKTGEMTMLTAYHQAHAAEAAAAKAAEAGEQAPEADAPDETEQPAKPKADVLDAYRNPVPKRFRPDFEARAAFAAVVKVLNDAKDKLEAIKAGDGSAHLDLGEAKKAIDGVARLVKDSQPHALCLDCHGRKCPECGQAGYVNSLTYRAQQVAQRKAEDAKAARAAARMAKAAEKGAANGDGDHEGSESGAEAEPALSE